MFSDLIPNEMAVRPASLGGGSALAPLSGPSISAQSVSGVQRLPTPVGEPVPFAPPASTQPSPATTSPAPAQPSALSAFETFYNSPTYQFPLQQGLKAVNTYYAARGALESGAAMKAIDQYGANSAAGALGTYMDQLYREQALGENAAAATAGVGENMVNQVSANNNAAGSAAANAALVGGQTSANNFNNIGSALGQFGGAVAGALGSSVNAGIPAPNLSAPMSVNLPAATPVASMPGFF